MLFSFSDSPTLFCPVSAAKFSSQPVAPPALGPGPVPGALLAPTGASKWDPSEVWIQPASITLNLLDCEILQQNPTADPCIC